MSNNEYYQAISWCGFSEIHSKNTGPLQISGGLDYVEGAGGGGAGFGAPMYWNPQPWHIPSIKELIRSWFNKSY